MNKRPIVLILSFATIICYGYALGGLGSYAVGNPQPVPVAAGLIGGTLCAGLAIKIWKDYLDAVEEEDRRIMDQILEEAEAYPEGPRLGKSERAKKNIF